MFFITKAFPPQPAIVLCLQKLPLHVPLILRVTVIILKFIIDFFGK